MAAGIEDIIIVTRRYNRAIEDLNSNIVGFLNILEACRHNSVKYLMYDLQVL